MYCKKIRKGKDKENERKKGRRKEKKGERKGKRKGQDHKRAFRGEMLKELICLSSEGKKKIKLIKITIASKVEEKGSHVL